MKVLMTGGVRLEGEREQVKHHPDVLLVAIGDAFGDFHIGHLRLKFLRALDAGLNVTHGRKSTRRSCAGRSRSPCPAAILASSQHGVEDAFLHALLAQRIRTVACGGTETEHALKDESRVHLGSHGHRFVLPGEIKLVGAGVAAVALAGGLRWPSVLSSSEGRRVRWPIFCAAI
jgi:hypothetical protein